MDVQDQPVVEARKRCFPCAAEPVRVWPSSSAAPGGEPALRAGHREPLPRENVPELAGQPVDGMPFRHYSMTSPVRS